MALDDSPILVASNRGPVQYRDGGDGQLEAHRGTGGLVTALGGVARHHGVTWVSHAMSAGDVRASRAAGGAFDTDPEHGAPYRLRLVGSPDDDYQRYYSEAANPLLWFLQHRLYGFATDPVIDRRLHAAWESYRRVNGRIAAAVVEEAAQLAGERAAPVVLVQDYHLLFVPGMVRASGLPDDAVLQFFLHIPWPDPGAWRALPRAWVRDACTSLLRCDVVGFQTLRDAENFLRTVHHFLGADIEFRTGRVRTRDRTVHVRSYPISVAVEEFERHAASDEVATLRGRVRGMRPAGDDGRLIVRVDRTDPSKNIVRGFQAFALLLEEHPEWQGRVSMFCQLDPSRQEISEYRAYRDAIEAEVQRIRDRFERPGWEPLHLNVDSNFLAGVAGYLEYDVLFVNPVADGMNLVSKEGPLVNRRDGVVVLSEQAGSFNELGPDTVAVNPFDIAQQADALHRALGMPAPERAERAARLRAQVCAHDVQGWMQAQLDDVGALREGRALVAQ